MSIFPDREALEAVFEGDISFSESTCRLHLSRNNGRDPVELFISGAGGHSSLTGVSASWLTRETSAKIVDSISSMQLSSVFEIQDSVLTLVDEIEETMDEESRNNAAPDASLADDFANVEIFEGDKVTDRKSKFISFCGKATTKEEAHRFVAALKHRVRKISSATHIMMAYQLSSGEAFRDDDGEGGAGDRLLTLLDQLHCSDVVVVVARFYGGIKLGPDRFKHISNSAKHVLVDNGFANQNQKSR